MDSGANSLGQSLHSDKVQIGLCELNPDISFDVQIRRPDEWGNVLQFPSYEAAEAVRKARIPILWRDTYICAMDRGIMPEFKQYSVKQAVVELPWSEADKDWTSIQYQMIHPYEDGYADLYELASLGSDPQYQLMGGALYKMRCMGYAKVRGKVLTLGWRHTFERLIRANIAGVTRESLASKFNVDLLKYPVGSPDELIAALVEE